MRLLIGVILIAVALLYGGHLIYDFLWYRFCDNGKYFESSDYFRLAAGIVVLVGGLLLARVCVQSYQKDHKAEIQRDYVASNYTSGVLQYYDKHGKLPRYGILTLHYPEQDMQYVIKPNGLWRTVLHYRYNTYDSGWEFKSVDGVSGQITVPYEVKWGISDEERIAVLDSGGRVADTEGSQDPETESDFWGGDDDSDW